MFGFFKKSKGPQVVTHRVIIRILDRGFSEKQFRKHMKKVIPWILDAELDTLVSEMRVSGRARLRLPKEVLSKLEKSDAIEVRNKRALIDIERACRCGDEICPGCACDVSETMRWGKTNLGIIEEDRFEGVEFDDDGDPLVYQYKGVK